ncbi:ABC transporter substrate-binding protein [Paraburkholderia sp. G-4-1-8]|uniref:ABC transporter substrate-binding protein n=2 Tax=Paraburkholderia antibiotica TaxID=2728839 RepID=A0A7X9X346_9BURK|nr:ABC transporter substrate-binding protein [Paraburkholderia antibiotica]
MLTVAAGIVPLQARAGQDIRVGYTLDALTMDPGNYRKRETEVILDNMHDGLLTSDGHAHVIPQLAASWKQIDATTYDFTLRHGVKFHDGEPMTAADVKFTFDRLSQVGALDGQTSPRAGLLGPLKQVEIVDKDTVRFILARPWPSFLAMLPFQSVVSRKFVDTVHTAGMATKENGTGPFRLVAWNRDESIVMDRFDRYYGGATPPLGAAKASRVIFEIIPESASRVAALLAGSVDLINDLPAHSIKEVEANKDTKVVTVNGTRTFFVALNNTKPPFNDPRVRRAANYAIDRKLVIDRILAGTAIPLNGPLSPDAFGFNPQLPAYDYDTAKAKRLLAEAGYPYGVDATLDVEGAFEDQGEVIASLLTKVGIRTRVAVGEGSVLKAKWSSKDKGGGDMWFTSWGDAGLDPEGIVNPTLTTGGRGNAAGYSNPQVDRLLTAASSEVDPARRAELYRQAQTLVNADAPWIFLWLPQDIYGVNARLRGWTPNADGRIDLRNAYVE